MRIGFTGTQLGMTEAQYRVLGATLVDHRSTVDNERSILHHGDCIGADAQAHDLAAMNGLKLVSHPPDIPDKRAWTFNDEERQPKPYLKRNKDIVAETEILVATPRGMAEEVRSGTWATVRYALNAKKPVTIIWPDGSIEVWQD